MWCLVHQFTLVEAKGANSPARQDGQIQERRAMAMLGLKQHGFWTDSACFVKQLNSIGLFLWDLPLLCNLVTDFTSESGHPVLQSLFFSAVIA